MPWTLSSRRFWEQPHRVGGWVFDGVGAALLVAGLQHTAWALMLAGGLLMAALLGLIFYSYIARADNNSVTGIRRRCLNSDTTAADATCAQPVATRWSAVMMAAGA